MNCLNPIKVYDSYVACGVCSNCKKDNKAFTLSQLKALCDNTIELENLKPSKSRKLSYKKFWKRYIKIQNKITKLSNKIKKLESKI